MQAQDQTAAKATCTPPAAPRRIFSRGRYQISRPLGEGGKKRVYLAHDTRLERDVALAIVKTQGLDDAGRARILREARAMGRLGDHPHIVTVYDVGEEGGEPFIVCQYMAGGSLEDLLRESGKRHLPLEKMISIGEQICRALEHAHTCGVIHRDLKPANVWMTKDGTAKLGDFGLALALDRSRLTMEGMMVGTVAYMPPEQALGQTPDARGDLYSLGALLYELATGRPPFLGDDAVAIISQHINTPPVAPTWHNAEVPRALEALILRLLAKDPTERPENATAVLASLAAIAAGKPASGPGAGEEVPPANALDRLAGGIFVGREKEMDELRANLEDTLSGHGRLVMLVGEPGIGKTRTAQELVTYAHLRKAQVLWGRCYEGEGAPAYWPWVQAIRSYVHERDHKALLSEMGSGASAIAQLVSEVRERIPGLPEPPKLDPEEARFRLFDSIATFLRNAAAGQPLVLVLDDLHCADKSSLLLLHFLAREIERARLLVVGTYRDVGLRRQHPLTQTLGELTREQLTHRILLRGLAERDVKRFIEITAGIDPPAALVAAVYKETEGNPFFVNEVVRLLVTDGRLDRMKEAKSWSVSIPQGVREVIGRRLDHLSAECNQILTTASVIGREFGLDALRAVAGMPEERVLERLEEAIAARVIAEVHRRVGRYVFSHALIRETLRDELSTTRRVRLHKQIGEALETLYGSDPEPHLAELAYHFSEAAQAGGADKAIAYAVRAGDRANGQLAYEEAAKHYETALQAMELVEPAGKGHRCELLLKLNDTLWSTGEFDRAKEVALRAVDLAREMPSPEHLARATLAYAGFTMAFDAVNRDETLVTLLEESLAALPRGDSALRAAVLGRLAEEILFTDPYERRDSLSREALEMARRVGDPGVLASVLMNRHWTIWMPDNLEERLALAAEVLKPGVSEGGRMHIVIGRLLHLTDLAEVGDLPAMKRELELSARLADELRQPYARWLITIARVLVAFMEGRLKDIEGLAQEAFEAGQETRSRNAALLFGLHLMYLRGEQGRIDEALPMIEESLGMYPDLRHSLRAGRAFALVEAGDLDKAREELENLVPGHIRDFPRNLAWLCGMIFLAEAIAVVRDEGRARLLYEALLPYAERFGGVPLVFVIKAVASSLARLAALLGLRDEAIRLFQKAIEIQTRAGTGHGLARTLVDYAEFLLDGGAPADTTRALSLLHQALDLASEREMKRVVERALELKLRALGIDRSDSLTSIDAVTVSVEKERPDLRAHASPDGTVTILFSDIENSTILTEQFGDRRWLEVLHAHNGIIREQVAAHGGFEVKSQGDGFMIAFQSAAGGLRCAIAVQHALADHAREHPDTAVRVRMGLHTGEVIKEEEDFFGKNVILAARIGARAKGGQVLVSSTMKDITQSLGEFTFGGGEETSLKGLSGTYQIYELAL